MCSSVVGDRGAHLLRALQGTAITVFYQDLDLKYVWIENPPEGWDVDQIVGQDDLTILPVEAAETTIAAKRRAISERENQRLELRVDLPTGYRWFDIWVDPDFDEDGSVKGVLCFSVEITDKKRKEVNLHQLLREVSHRSRNLLAIVQGLATQTLKTSDNHEELAHFNSRLQSLAFSLDLVTREKWDGAYMQDLVNGQLTPYLEPGANPFIEGNNPKLTPNAAIHVGLAIQELASKSIGYSGMKLNSEKVVICIAEDADSTVLEWREHCPEARQLHPRHMLDETILLKIAPLSVSGNADISFQDGKLLYALTIPSGNLL